MMWKTLLISAGLLTGTALYADMHEKKNGSASTDDSKDTIVDDARQVGEELKKGVYDLLDKHAVSIDFEKGQHELSDSAKSDIRSLMQAIDQNTKLDNVTIAAWSDEDAPTAQDTELPEEQQDLASRRLNAVDDFVTGLENSPETDTYNMAQKVGWLSDFLETDQAKVKSMTASGKEPKADQKKLDAEAKKRHKIAKIFTEKGGASKAVVIAVPEDVREMSH